MLPFSPKVITVLAFDNSDMETEQDFQSLTRSLVKTFDTQKIEAAALLANANQKMKLAVLGGHLFQLAKADSAVRDIQTTGHLCKLISRWHVFEVYNKYDILALPNVLFDKVSQTERTEFFSRGGIQYIDGAVLELKGVKEMLDLESEILSRAIGSGL